MRIKHVHSVYKIGQKSFELCWSVNSIIKEINNTVSLNYVAVSDNHIIGYVMG